MGGHAPDPHAARGQVAEHRTTVRRDGVGKPEPKGAPASPRSRPESAVTTSRAAGSAPFATSTSPGSSRRVTPTPGVGRDQVAEPPVSSRARERSRARFCSIRPPTIEARPFGSASANTTRGTRAARPRPVTG